MDQNIAAKASEIVRSLGLTPAEASFAVRVAQMLFDGSMMEWQQYERQVGEHLRPRCLPAAFATGWLHADAARKMGEAGEAARAGTLPAGPTMEGRWFGPNGEPLPEPPQPPDEGNAFVHHFVERLNVTAGVLDEPVPSTDLRLRWSQTGPTASVAAFDRAGTLEAMAIMLTKGGQPAEDLRVLDKARAIWPVELPPAVLNEVASGPRPVRIIVYRSLEGTADSTLLRAIWHFVGAFRHVQVGYGRPHRDAVAGMADSWMEMSQQLKLTQGESGFVFQLGNTLAIQAKHAADIERQRINPRHAAVEAAFTIGMQLAESWERSAGDAPAAQPPTGTSGRNLKVTEMDPTNLQPDTAQGFGTAKPGDYYGPHLWDELGRLYTVLCEAECDDPSIMAEAQRRREIVQDASRGKLPKEAFFFEKPVPSEHLDQVIAEVNAALRDHGKWTNPPQLNVRLMVPSRALGATVAVGIASKFIADLQSWAEVNCVRFRPRS